MIIIFEWKETYWNNSGRVRTKRNLRSGRLSRTPLKAVSELIPARCGAERWRAPIISTRKALPDALTTRRGPPRPSPSKKGDALRIVLFMSTIDRSSKGVSFYLSSIRALTLHVALGTNWGRCEQFSEKIEQFGVVRFLRGTANRGWDNNMPQVSLFLILFLNYLLISFRWMFSGFHFEKCLY